MMAHDSYPVYTIGHSTHPTERFVDLLQQHQIAAVADVRSSPYSRFNPQFNRETLEKSLRSVGIKYVFLGKELGARSDDPKCYEDGRVQYQRLAQTPLFQEGIDRVVKGHREYRIALMCAEKEPLECHRTVLVARTLVSQGVPVNHILGDGRLEEHESTMERLLDVFKMPHRDLFHTKEQLISEALMRQEKEIAYVVQK